MNSPDEHAGRYWAAKILLLLHDPPAKPYFFRPYSGGHGQLARRIINAVYGETGKRKGLYHADILATGADRPMLSLPRTQGNGLGTRFFHKNPLVTHPLDRVSLQLRHPGGEQDVDSRVIQELEILQLETSAGFKIAMDAGPDALKETFFLLWRQFKDALIQANPADRNLWEYMPADSRCPDHPIWEHNRLTSALSFVNRSLSADSDEEPDHPWLFSFALRPVQEFLSQARKSQDLWTGSMLLAELSFAAMQPIIDKYGPDVIIYPDLRGNPRADIRFADLLHSTPAATRAAVIPHTFVAILPRGDGRGYLEEIEALGRRCSGEVREKWKMFTHDVRSWMESCMSVASGSSRGSAWKELWQHGLEHCPLEPTWVAIPWPMPIDRRHYYTPGRALPCQDVPEKGDDRGEESKQQRQQQHRLGRWMPGNVNDHYNLVQEVFSSVNRKWFLQSGVLYAQAHHKLKVLHGIRRRTMTIPGSYPADISLEKCTICHERPALGNRRVGGRQHAESIRLAVSRVWQLRDFDPEQQGSERLCPVCSVRRFLVRSDSGRKGELNTFNRVCFGPNASCTAVQDSDGRVRTPFASTVQIAAQGYLAGLAQHHAALDTELRAVLRMHRQLDLGRPSFPRGLPRLGKAAATHSLARDFLELDPQLTLFPEQARARMQYVTGSARKNWEKLERAVTELRASADRLLRQSPGTQVAVLTMDGDRMGELLLGMPGRIHVRWRDILHPDIDRKVRERFKEYGWGDLRQRSRMAGPALHAFVSRALADFNHHIAPWVVEQEYGGRLIYSGGDDLLALVPVTDAMAVASRLHELFTAPWLIDTRSDTHPWSWLEQGRVSWDPVAARQRFKPFHQGMDQKTREKWLRSGRLIAMLGKSGHISAGIACGHFKTRMGLLLRTSHTLLEEWAKERAGRQAAGLGHFSRNGIKTMFAAPWRLGADTKHWPISSPDARMMLAEAVETVIDGFTRGTLPKALPYKLVAGLELLDPSRLPATAEQRLALLTGMVRHATEKPLQKDLLRAVLHLWSAGFYLSEPVKKNVPEKHGRQTTESRPQSLAGLFFCRYLYQHRGSRT